MVTSTHTVLPFFDSCTFTIHNLPRTKPLDGISANWRFYSNNPTDAAECHRCQPFGNGLRMILQLAATLREVRLRRWSRRTCTCLWFFERWSLTACVKQRMEEKAELRAGTKLRHANHSEIRLDWHVARMPDALDECQPTQTTKSGEFGVQIGTV